MASDVFLTGATGYAGSAVLEELMRSGRSVTALARWPVEVPGATWVLGELGMLDEQLDVVAAAGSIVHLASGRSGERDIALFEDIHGTGQLVDAWRRGTFVYGSTSSIHGLPRGVLGPDTPVHIEDWYDCAKAVNEFQVRDLDGRDGRGPGISLRPTLYFGPSRRPPDRQYLAWFFHHALEGHAIAFDSEEALEMTGAAFIGLGDFGRAVVAALGLPNGGAYPIATGFVTWRDLMATVNRVAGTSGRWVVRPTGPEGQEEFRVAHSRTELDSSAFRAVSGWEPQETLDELVAAFVRGEREAGRA